MSAPANEYQPSVFVMPETRVEAVGETDIALEALQAYFGPATKVLNYDSTLRRDYYGDASNKTLCGGALLVECAIFADGARSEQTLVIDNDNRLLDNDMAITVLDAKANANWYAGKGTTLDYARSRRI